MNEVSVKWVDDLTFSAHTGSGHTMVIAGGGGPDKPSAGPSPMEMLLVGAAGCTGIDVVNILKRQRQPLEHLVVNVSGERATDPPQIYTKIIVEYVVTGAVDEKKLERAIQLSEEKYCSASAMLGAVAEITSTFRFNN